MNLKTFSQQSRRILIKGVEKKLMYWGFNAKGVVVEEPVAIEGGYLLRTEAYDDASIPAKWNSLRDAIQKKGIEIIIEEAAYTWFNRIMAIRILSKNNYDRAQLEYEGDTLTPEILVRARRGQVDFLSPSEQIRLQKIITDYSKEKEAFAILLTGYCGHHDLIRSIFGRLDDYTELLLPDDILEQGGMIHLLNTTDAIPDEEYRKVELIGWLYQFYISEKKDEVFASFKKNQKAEAKDIPAATQIFTPNWIVKYMVQNTVGKLWLDLNPDSPIRSEMKYLIEDPEQTQAPIISESAQLKLLDPAVGSGHILVEGFDLLYRMYDEEYYTPEEAVKSILTNNLFGLDIDLRAAQLARFAVLLKAAQFYPDVLKKGWMPQIYAMPEAYFFTRQEILDYLGKDGLSYEEELTDALKLMRDAQNLGSTMIIDLSRDGMAFLIKRLQELEKLAQTDFGLLSLLYHIRPFIQIMGILSDHFEAVVANPPYMGSGNMNGPLKDYINAQYPISKSDLYTVMIERISEMITKSGRFGLITPPSWLFTISNAKLRERLLDECSLDSILNFGRGVFGADFGSVSFTAKKNVSNDSHIVVCRSLFRGKSYVDSIEQKESWFFDKTFNRFEVAQSKFNKVPNRGIAYWIPEKAFDCFEKLPSLQTYYDAKVGLQTSDNDRFRRDWPEVNFKKTTISKNFNNKWIPYNSGGEFRKWYGNQNYLINWENNGEEIKSISKSVVRNSQYYFSECITWSKVTIGGLAFRFIPKGFIFDVAGCSIFNQNEDDLFYLQGILNSKLKEPFVYAITQSVNYEVGIINNFPFKEPDTPEKKGKVIALVKECVSLAKEDWDKSEVSWFFQRPPFIEAQNLEIGVYDFQTKVQNDLIKIYQNEVLINEILLTTYDLENELNTIVPLKEITLYQDIISFKKDQNGDPIKIFSSQKINKVEIISQLISYAVGISMGRYRLDSPGLHIAHPDPTSEEVATYSYQGHSIEIDEDAIIPIMGSAGTFADDALKRVKFFLEVIWGADTLTQNLNFMQECLDEDLESYLVKKFWADHCKTYKKKPIYWLFSSEKGAFQVLAYMHRMNAFTVEKVRSNYLMPHLKHLRYQIDRLETNHEDPRQLEKLQKNLSECESYDLVLKDVADKQITFDLDDGVTKNYELFEGVVGKVK
ncbi:MAG: BREX-1 system adenine-specific DNA-methyltransferase PglX [Algoriphagus sp.]|nr:BREX-1 system adenine-specific DNA-methyltransferase PglX [Algoriphagus sp.]